MITTWHHKIEGKNKHWFKVPNDFHKEFTHTNNTHAQIHIPLYTFLYIRTCMILFVFVVVKHQYATMHEAHHAKLRRRQLRSELQDGSCRKWWKSSQPNRRTSLDYVTERI
jgi:hypothetical protein